MDYDGFFEKTKQDFWLRDFVDYKSKKTSAQNTLKRSLDRSQNSPKVKIVQFIRSFWGDSTRWSCGWDPNFEPNRLF